MKSVNQDKTKQAVPLPPGFLKDPGHLLAFGLGSGALPKAPGTWGSVVAVPIYYLLWVWLPASAYVVMLFLTFLVGVWLCGRTSRALGVHDHGGIVWDEFVGVWITLATQPVSPLWVLAGLVLFRIFDIAKPWPIRWLDRKVHGGLGIMLDDVLAGLVALALVAIAQHVLR